LWHGPCTLAYLDYFKRCKFYRTDTKLTDIRPLTIKGDLTLILYIPLMEWTFEQRFKEWTQRCLTFDLCFRAVTIIAWLLHTTLFRLNAEQSYKKNSFIGYRIYTADIMDTDGRSADWLTLQSDSSIQSPLPSTLCGGHKVKNTTDKTIHYFMNTTICQCDTVFHEDQTNEWTLSNTWFANNTTTFIKNIINLK
jgi:hypothetical protein